MERHLIDKARTKSDTPRLREYLRLERSEKRHPAIETLHRKPHGASARKLTEYARIARGETA